MEWIVGPVIIIGVFAILAVRQHFHESKQLRIREIQHEERMKMIDNNLPLTDLSPMMSEGQSDQVPMSKVEWTRLIAFGLGLTSFFGGIGMSAALYYQTEIHVQQSWAAGFIPMFMGVGLILFYKLSADIATSREEEPNG
jgi:hypothetical protein